VSSAQPAQTIESLRKKMTSRVVLLRRLAGSGWGAGARRGFLIRLKRLKPWVPDFLGPQNFEVGKISSIFVRNCIYIFILFNARFLHAANKRSIWKNEHEGLK